MEFVLFYIAFNVLVYSVSGLGVASKVDFENDEATTVTTLSSEPESSESREIEITTELFYWDNKQSNKLKGSVFEAKIPVIVSSNEKKYEVKIPVKLEAKKEKPGNSVKFYKGVKAKNTTSGVKRTGIKTGTEGDELSVPVVKGSFFNVKPDFLVPIPKETNGIIRPFGNFENNIRRIWSNQQQRKYPVHIEGLQPPPLHNSIGPTNNWNEQNCTTSYSGTCQPPKGGHYPNVGQVPPPTYGVPGMNQGSWNNQNGWPMTGQGNSWNSQGQNMNWNNNQIPTGGNWNPTQGNNWGYQRPPSNQNHPRPNPNPNYWNQGNNNDNNWSWGGNQGSTNTFWNSQRPSPNWGSQNSNTGNNYPPLNTPPGNWNSYNSGNGIQQGTNTRGRWIPCKPFEIASPREEGSMAMTDCRHSKQSDSFQMNLPPATPASKIDDKTLFKETIMSPDVEEISRRF